MPLSYKPFDALAEEDLQKLVTDGISERKRVEYKQTLPGKTSTDRKEFLRDVTSFANTVGGFLLYGVVDREGVPVDLRGVGNVSADGEILRLEEILRRGVQPRLARTVHIPLAEGKGAVIAVKIDKSWVAPHQVTFEDEHRFWGRGNKGKYSLEVGDIRAAFEMGDRASERMRRFRTERIEKVIGGNMPVTMVEGPRLVVHLMPLAAFTGPTSIDIPRLSKNWRDLVDPNDIGPWEKYFVRVTFDGLVVLKSRAHQNASPMYVLVFRSGAVEIVFSEFHQDTTGKNLGLRFEVVVLKNVQRVLPILHNFEVGPPIVCGLTFIDVTGYQLPGINWSEAAVKPIDRDCLVVPEVVIEDMETTAERELKPAFDSVWNAGGYPASPSYDENGNRSPGRQ